MGYVKQKKKKAIQKLVQGASSGHALAKQKQPAQVQTPASFQTRRPSAGLHNHINGNGSSLTPLKAPFRMPKIPRGKSLKSYL